MVQNFLRLFIKDLCLIFELSMCGNQPTILRESLIFNQLAVVSLFITSLVTSTVVVLIFIPGLLDFTFEPYSQKICMSYDCLKSLTHPNHLDRV